MPGTRKVIVRAIGPSLNVPGKLADPTLELHDGNGGLLDSNDNWVDSPNKQAIIDSTIPPDEQFGISHRCDLAFQRHALHRHRPRRE